MKDKKNEFISNDILIDNIAKKYLSVREIRALACTSSFFSTNEQLKKIIKQKFSAGLEIIIREYWIFFFHHDLKWLYQQDNRYSKSPLLRINLSNSVIPKQIFTNGYTSFVICKDKSLYGWGSYEYGDVETIDRSIARLQPIILPDNDFPKEILQNKQSTFILCESGHLYRYGSHLNKMLRLGKPICSFPERVLLPNNDLVRKVFLFKANTIFTLCESGHLYGCGSNHYGELGLGHFNTEVSSLLRIPVPEDDIEQVISTGFRTLILCKSGNLYGCGLQRTNLQLINLPENHKVPKKIIGNGGSIFIVCHDESLYGYGNNLYGQLGLGDTVERDTPQLISFEEKKVKQIYVADGSLFIISESGNLYGCGKNNCGSLGVGDRKDRDRLSLVPLPENELAQKIISDEDKTFVISKNGNLYGCGNNYQSELGGLLPMEENFITSLKIISSIIPTEENISIAENQRDSCTRF